MNEINGKFLFALWLPLMLFFIMFFVCVCAFYSHSSFTFSSQLMHMKIFIVFFLYSLVFIFLLFHSPIFSLFQPFSIYSVICIFRSIHSLLLRRKCFSFMYSFFSLSLSSQHIQLQIHRYMMFAMHRNDTIIQVM